MTKDPDPKIDPKIESQIDHKIDPLVTHSWMDEYHQPFPKYVAVEGPIGAGKTTLAHELAQLLDYKCFEEPTSKQKNPLLHDFYKDPQSFAFPMQIQMLTIRLELERSATTQIATQEIKGAVTDRTTDGDSVFAFLNYQLGNISLPLYQLYLRTFNIMKSIRPYPDLIIYLDVPVPTLKQRIKQRNRSFEQNLTKQDDTYLYMLERAYQPFLHAISAFSCVISIPWHDFKPTNTVWNRALQQYQAVQHSRFEKTLLRH